MRVTIQTERTDLLVPERRKRARRAPGYASRKGEKLVNGLTRSDLVVKYSSMVRIIAAQVARNLPGSVEVDDLVSVGYIGLMDAAEKFNPRQNVKFETFASFRVRGAIYDELRKTDWVPRSVRSRIKEIDEAYARIEADKGRAPTDSELSEELGMSRDSFQKVRARVGNLSLVYSNENEPIEATDKKPSLELVQSAPIAGDPVAELSRKEAREMLEELMQGLSDNERTVLSCYYFRGLRLKEIADILNLSEPRVSQLHSAGILKLKTALKERAQDAQDLFLMLFQE